MALFGKKKDNKKTAKQAIKNTAKTVNNRGSANRGKNKVKTRANAGSAKNQKAVNTNKGSVNNNKPTNAKKTNAQKNNVSAVNTIQYSKNNNTGKQTVKQNTDTTGANFKPRSHAGMGNTNQKAKPQVYRKKNTETAIKESTDPTKSVLTGKRERYNPEAETKLTEKGGFASQKSEKLRKKKAEAGNKSVKVVDKELAAAAVDDEYKRIKDAHPEMKDTEILRFLSTRDDYGSAFLKEVSKRQGERSQELGYLKNQRDNVQEAAAVNEARNASLNDIFGTPVLNVPNTSKARPLSEEAAAVQDRIDRYGKHGERGLTEYEKAEKAARENGLSVVGFDVQKNGSNIGKNKQVAKEVAQQYWDTWLEQNGGDVEATIKYMDDNLLGVKASRLVEALKDIAEENRSEFVKQQLETAQQQTRENILSGENIDPRQQYDSPEFQKAVDVNRAYNWMDETTATTNKLQNMGRSLGQGYLGAYAGAARLLGGEKMAEAVRRTDEMAVANKASAATKAGRVGVDVLSQAGMQLANLPFMAIGGALGGATKGAKALQTAVTGLGYGASTAGQELQHAYDSGATAKEARTSAAVSALLETALGGLSEARFIRTFNGNVNAGGKFIANTIKRSMAEAGISAGMEGATEYLTSVGQNAASRIIYGNENKSVGEIVKEELGSKENWYAAGLGAMIGGGMGAVGGIGNGMADIQRELAATIVNIANYEQSIDNISEALTSGMQSEGTARVIKEAAEGVKNIQAQNAQQKMQQQAVQNAKAENRHINTAVQETSIENNGNVVYNGITQNENAVNGGKKYGSQNDTGRSTETSDGVGNAGESSRKRQGSQINSQYDGGVQTERTQYNGRGNSRMVSGVRRPVNNKEPQRIIADVRRETKHGACVDEPTPADYASGKVTGFVSEDGEATISVKSDGDIVAFGKTKDCKVRGVAKDLMYTALQNGGTKLDCYGKRLAIYYQSKYGMVPVAKVKYNPEFADENMKTYVRDVRGGEGMDIYVMAHNGDNINTIQSTAENGGYELTDLDSLPVMEYDKALAYRDGLIGKDNNYDVEDNAQIEIDPVSNLAANPGPQPGATNSKLSLSNPNIQQNDKNVNTVYKQKNRSTTGAIHGKNALQPTSETVPVDTSGQRLTQNQQNVNTENNTNKGGRRDNRDNSDSLDDLAEPRNKVRKHAKTIYDSPAADAQIRSDIKKLVEDGTLQYTPTMNSELLAKADESLKKYNGNLKEEAAEAKGGLATGKLPTDEAIAKAELVLSRAIKAKDYSTVQNLVVELTLAGTELGRALQVLSLLKRLTPQGKLMYLERVVQKTNDRTRSHMTKKQRIAMIEKRVEKHPEIIKLPQEYYDKILKSKTQEESDIAMKEALSYIAEHTPATLSDKYDAWRYMAMLGNPRTHIRNLCGNILMLIARNANNAIGGLVQDIAIKKEKTKTLRRPTDEQRAFAEKEFETAEKLIKTGGKYGIDFEIRDGQKIFKNKWLESFRKKNMELLDKEDMLFMKRAFITALSKYMRANGLDGTYLKTDTEEAQAAYQKALDYSVKEAQRATYREENALASALNRAERWNPDVGRGVNIAKKVAVGGTVAFKKTPFNIAKRSMEYSPVGVVKGWAVLKKRSNQLEADKKSNIQVGEVVDCFTEAATGTAAMALGLYMASRGILTSVIDGDDDERNYKKELGMQNYAIKTGDYTFTLDWAAPIAVPFFLGCELYNVFRDSAEDDINIVSRLLGAVASMGEPIIQMSCFQGILSTFTNGNYGTKSDGEKAMSIAGNIVGGYIQQFIPTVVGQLARTIDGTKRTAKANANNPIINKTVDRWIKQQMNKIPGLSQKNEPDVSVWGEEKSRGKWYKRAFESFLSPGYLEKNNTTEIDGEIIRLYNATGDNSLIPATPDGTITEDGKKYALSPQEYTNYKKNYGQSALAVIKKIMSRDDYKNANDGTKAQMIQYCYEYAGEVAKHHTLQGKGVKTDVKSWIKTANSADNDLTIDKAIVEKTLDKVWKDNQPDSTSESSDQNKDLLKLNEIYNNGWDIGTYYQNYAEFSSINAKDDNGKTVNGLGKKRRAAWLRNADIPEDMKDYYWGTTNYKGDWRTVK